MPVSFWNDPAGSVYRGAYFERFPGVWRQGDWARLTPSGGVVIYGRSDTTLNPGGVRIGTAEIYRQVEQLPEIVECVVVSYDVDAVQTGESAGDAGRGYGAHRRTPRSPSSFDWPIGPSWMTRFVPGSGTSSDATPVPIMCHVGFDRWPTFRAR